MDKWNVGNWRFPIDERKKEEGLLKIRRAVQAKRMINTPTFWNLILEQMRFQPIGYWICQGSLLLLALLLSIHFRSAQGEEPTSVIVVSVFCVLAGNISLGSLTRIFSWHMAELEQTLFLDLKQMISIQLLRTGILDLCILSLFMGLLGPGRPEGMIAFAMYLLVPFLWANICWLLALTAWRGRMRGYRQNGLGLLCTFLALMPALLPGLYGRVYLPIWGIFLAAGFAGLILTVKQLYKKSERGDMICLN